MSSSTSSSFEGGFTYIFIGFLTSLIITAFLVFAVIVLYIYNKTTDTFIKSMDDMQNTLNTELQVFQKQREEFQRTIDTMDDRIHKLIADNEERTEKEEDAIERVLSSKNPEGDVDELILALFKEYKGYKLGIEQVKLLLVLKYKCNTDGFGVHCRCEWFCRQGFISNNSINPRAGPWTYAR